MKTSPVAEIPDYASAQEMIASATPSGVPDYTEAPRFWSDRPPGQARYQ